MTFDEQQSEILAWLQPICGVRAGRRRFSGGCWNHVRRSLSRYRAAENRDASIDDRVAAVISVDCGICRVGHCASHNVDDVEAIDHRSCCRTVDIARPTCLAVHPRETRVRWNIGARAIGRILVCNTRDSFAQPAPSAITTQTPPRPL